MSRKPGPVSLVMALVLPLALVACAGESLLPAGGVSKEQPAGATPTASSGAAFPSLTNVASEGDPGPRVVIQNPTLAEVMQKGELSEITLGRADAPVTIIKYASLTCPYCRRFHAEDFPALKREYIDTGKVRFIIREFPIGKSSGNATIALRCAPESKQLDLYGRFLAQQASWVSQEVRIDAIFKVASQVGVTRAQLDACLQNQAMIKALNAVKERGRTLGIIGTPNFFIQNRLVKKAIGIKEIREIVDPLLAGTPPATAAQR